MNSSPYHDRAFRIRNPRHQRIHERLRRLIGEGTASFFCDACRLLDGDSDLVTDCHLAAHDMREVESSLRQVLEPFDVEQAVPTPSGSDKHAKSIRKVCTALNVSQELLESWLGLVGDKNPDNLARRAHRDDLRSPRLLDREFRDYAERVFTIFDLVLDATERNYSAVFAGLGELLAKPTPDESDLERLTRKMPNTGLAQSYFFDRLIHPGWLEPLRAEGILTRVPALEHDEEEGLIGFPSWPAGPYLLRLSSGGDRHVQEVVADVLTALPDTENTQVHAQVAEIALALPIELARKVSTYVENGLRKPYSIVLPNRALRFAIYLTGGGATDEANRIVRVLFELLPDPDGPKKIEEHTFSPTPRPRMQSGLYGHELSEIAPILIDADPLRGASTFAELLAEGLERSRGERSDGRHSFSQVGWPDLRSNAAQSQHDPKDHLLGWLKGASLRLAQREPNRIPELVAKLEEHGWLAHKRVILYMLAEVPGEATDLADSYAGDLSLLGDSEVAAEHQRLLRLRFANLPSEVRERVVDWIRTDDDVARARESLSQWLEREPAAEELEDYIRRHRYRRFRTLAGVLPPDLNEEFQQLSTQYESEQPEAGIRPIAWGNRSPVSAEELLRKTDADLIQYLHGVELGHDLTGPSMEGLGDVVAEVAGAEPQRLSSIAASFVGLDPLLVSGFFRGLDAGARAKAPMDWSQIIQLCEWVVSQPREIPGRKTRFYDRDPGWVWTRRQIGSLLEEGVKPEPSPIPISSRVKILSILRILCEDPEPEEEQQDSDQTINTAINSVRGIAIRSVVFYALWLRRADQSVHDLEATGTRGILERHLDPAADKSPAVRSVYGQFLPALMWIDPAWVRGIVQQVFPLDSSAATLRRAAWAGYVRFNRPSRDLVELFEPIYRAAIDDVAHSDSPTGKQDSEEENLAEHLVILAWSGLIPIGNEGGLLQYFFAKVPPRVRAAAIGAVGRALSNTEGEVAEEIASRIREIWEHRLAEVLGSNPLDSKEELAEFGWWFVSAKLDPQWSLKNLQTVLTHSDSLDAEYQAYERISQLTPPWPVLCMKCLDLMIQPGTRRRWSLDLSEDHLGKALRAALDSGDPEARDLARSIANKLSAHGYPGYLRLLGGR